MIRLLSSLIGVGNCGVNINSPDYGDCFRDFAKQVVKEYIEVSEVEFNDYDDFVLTVFEFNEVAKNHLYGKSCEEVNRYLHKKYNVNMRDVVGFEDSKYYVLVDRMDDYKNIVGDKTEICNKVYEIMGKYDHFNVLEKGKVKISFLLKSALDEEVGSYLIRRTLI